MNKTSLKKIKRRNHYTNRKKKYLKKSIGGMMQTLFNMTSLTPARAKKTPAAVAPTTEIENVKKKELVRLLTSQKTVNILCPDYDGCFDIILNPLLNLDQTDLSETMSTFLKKMFLETNKHPQPTGLDDLEEKTRVKLVFCGSLRQNILIDKCMTFNSKLVNEKAQEAIPALRKWCTEQNWNMVDYYLNPDKPFDTNLNIGLMPLQDIPKLNYTFQDIHLQSYDINTSFNLYKKDYNYNYNSLGDSKNKIREGTKNLKYVVENQKELFKKQFILEQISLILSLSQDLELLNFYFFDDTLLILEHLQKYLIDSISQLLQGRDIKVRVFLFHFCSYQFDSIKALEKVLEPLQQEIPINDSEQICLYLIKSDGVRQDSYTSNYFD